ncbi:hypothetical protein KKA47_05075, partial [bacterium]|nr:hypothetical protein [bacterium]
PTDNFQITSVVMTEETTIYYNTVEHWIVSAELCGGYYKYTMGHMANIAEDLRNKMVAAGYTDPWSGNFEIDENLITGASINLSANEEIGQPQVQAEEIGEYDGYLKGPGSIPQSPMAQIEYSIDKHDGTRINRYSLESETDRATYEAMITNEDSTLRSFRYEHDYLHPWLWRAEMYLSRIDCVYCNNPPTDIFAMNQMGNWWEYDGPDCLAGNNMCDHVFVIHPIYKSSSFYDSSYYHSSDVSYLAYMHTYGDVDSDKKGEVIYPASPDDTRGTMTIKWRLVGAAEETMVTYHGLSYFLNNDTNILKIAWNNAVNTEATVTHPSIPDADTVCNGITIMCYTYWRENLGTYSDI